jgi:hypothetical protein
MLWSPRCLEPDVPEENANSFSAPFHVNQLDDFLDADLPDEFFTTG